jgi:hypothetical protein
LLALVNVESQPLAFPDVVWIDARRLQRADVENHNRLLNLAAATLCDGLEPDEYAPIRGVIEAYLGDLGPSMLWDRRNPVPAFQGGDVMTCLTVVFVDLVCAACFGAGTMAIFQINRRETK